MKKIYFLIIILILNFSLYSNISADTVNENILNIIEDVKNNQNSTFLTNHPVGSIYITTASDENTAAKVASKYGGTWGAYGTNRVLRGTTGTAGSTGGNSSVTLTSSQIPSISTSGTVAAQSVTTASTGSGYTISYNTTGTNNATSGTTGSGYSIGYTFATRTTSSSGAHQHYATIKKTSLASGTTAHVIDTTSTDLTVNAVTTSNGDHYHTVTEYYVNSISGVEAHAHMYTNNYMSSLSGIGAHTHTLTVSARTLTSTYTNSSQSSVSVLDPYITVYMYKRTA